MSFGFGDEEKSSSFFRGGELPKLLVLTGILVAGSIALVAQFWTDGPKQAPQPVAVTKATVEPIEPDQSEEFKGVRDLTETSLLDNAPKKLLLERARETKPADLDAQAHRDVLFTHLWDRPDQYRGVPVHIEGTALRMITYEVSPTFTPQRRLYEAWITTAESQRFPYCCVFEDLPAGFPIGPNISEFVSFNGYFLKKLAYVAGDKPRGAPLLIGKLGWRPQASDRAFAPGAAPGQGGAWNWKPYAIGAVVFYIAFRFLNLMRRLLTSGSKSKPKTRTFVIETEPVKNMDALLANIPDDDDLSHRDGG